MQKAYDWEENYWENKPSTKTPVNKTNMDKLSNGVCTIDERVITLDLTKFDKVDAQSCIKQIAYDKATGKWTITAFSGAQQVIDTMLEKLAVDFDYDPETQRLIITLDDGTQKYADLSALITQFEFMDSDTVYWTVGAGGKVKADIKNGSITDEKLQPDYLAEITVQAETAIQQATAAATSAAQAKIDADRAESYAKITEPKFYLDETTMNLYMKDGVGVDFVVVDNVLYWKVA